MRIRNIKPELFKHEKLSDLENDNKDKYVMLTFIGLFGLCDNQGVFYYSPRMIKLDVLPFIDYDLEEALLILQKNGFFTVFEVNGKKYGFIESFTTHQRLSGKEAGDEGRKHPSPPTESADKELVDTREAIGKQRGSNGEATGKHLNAQEEEEEEEEGEGEITHARTRKIKTEFNSKKIITKSDAKKPSKKVPPKKVSKEPDDWTQVAKDMAGFYEGEGVSQWEMMCDAAGGYVSPLVMTTIWAGKNQDSPYVLKNWRKNTGKLTNWIKNQLKESKRGSPGKFKKQTASTSVIDADKYKEYEQSGKAYA